MEIDHVKRRELDSIESQLQEGQGRRTAFAAASSVVVTLLALALGFMYNNQITKSEVTEQIQIESPWAADKPGFDDKLDIVTLQLAQLRAEVGASKQRQQLICKKLNIDC
jgi:hypothetical protein